MGETKRCTAFTKKQTSTKKKDDIDKVNKLTTSSDQARVIVLYKVDTGSDGNKMPLHTYKNIL